MNVYDPDSGYISMMPNSSASGGGGFGKGLGSALSWGGRILGALGSIEAGNQQSKSLKKKAKYLRMEGREEKRLSDYRTRLIRTEGAGIQGDIEAETAKSGLAMTGTPLATLIDTARQVELSAQLENRAGTITQQRYEQAAEAAEKDAKAAKRAGRLGALGALLG